MELGTGIAVAGFWLLPCTALLCKRVSKEGVWAAITIAIVLTLIII